MLHEVATINNGSSAIERIQRCIALAKKLKGEGVRGRGLGADFLAFLEDEMFKGEKPASEAKAEKGAQ